MDHNLPGERFCLYNAAQLDVVLDTMADAAANVLAPASEPLLLGILRRGVPLAEKLGERIAHRHNLKIPRCSLKLKRYGDDLTLLHPDTELTENDEIRNRDLHATTVLVVDDVLYQGHSLARVLAYLSNRGAPEIRVAVLVDRCVAQLPVHADIIGIKLQVAPTDVVECNVPPYEGDFKIEVLRRP